MLTFTIASKLKCYKYEMLIALNTIFFLILGELEANKSNIESLRTNLKQENQFINFGVTPTFQSFVAKKLDEMLEKYVSNINTLNVIL